jgi:hypothetical protein
MTSEASQQVPMPPHEQHLTIVVTNPELPPFVLLTVKQLFQQAHQQNVKLKFTIFPFIQWLGTSGAMLEFGKALIIHLNENEQLVATPVMNEDRNEPILSLMEETRIIEDDEAFQKFWREIYNIALKGLVK